MNGARADVLFPITRHWGIVAEVNGVHAGNMGLASAPGLTLFTYMTGPRFSYPLRYTCSFFSQILYSLASLLPSSGALPHLEAMNTSRRRSNISELFPSLPPDSNSCRQVLL